MKLLFILTCALFMHICVNGQTILHIDEGNTVTVSSGETLYLDGFVLMPSDDFSLPEGSFSRGIAVASAATNPEAAIQRTYLFSNPTPAYTGTIRLGYADDELNGIDESLLVVNYFNGAVWQSIPTASNDVTDNYVQSESITSSVLGELTLTSLLQPLPLVWGLVSALPEERGVSIRFSCYEISNIGKLLIQRSADGRNWTDIHSLLNPDENITSFQFLDETTLSGVIFYRIAAVERSGETGYSRTVQANIRALQEQIALKNNPILQSFALTGSLQADKIKEVILFTSSGTRVQQWHGYQPTYRLRDVAAGVYFIQVVFTNGSTKLLRALIQR